MVALPCACPQCDAVQDVEVVKLHKDQQVIVCSACREPFQVTTTVAIEIKASPLRLHERARLKRTPALARTALDACSAAISACAQASRVAANDLQDTLEEAAIAMHDVAGRLRTAISVAEGRLQP